VPPVTLRTARFAHLLPASNVGGWAFLIGTVYTSRKSVTLFRRAMNFGVKRFFR
jgi:hypothetical protein